MDKAVDTCIELHCPSVQLISVIFCTGRSPADLSVASSDCQSSNPQLRVILVRATCTPKPRCASDSLSSGCCHQTDIRYQCLVGFYDRQRLERFFETWNSLWFLSAWLA